MDGFDTNPFADPFNDNSVKQATNKTNEQPVFDEFSPFSDKPTSSNSNYSAPSVPTDPSPSYSNQENKSSNLLGPPVAVPTPTPTFPGHDELLRRQAELDAKAEELERKERNMASVTFNPRANNWPPLPAWFPVKPCFYQDFDVDIPSEFKSTVKMVYYLWILYVVIMLNNVFASLAYYILSVNNSKLQPGGSHFGLSILWYVLSSPFSLCWYRPVYKAFRSDSSFNFFLFFFIMFFQICVSIFMCVGIIGSGYTGWILAITIVGSNLGVGIYAFVQSVFFTIMVILSIVLLKKVHSIYRSTDGSFEKAQQEFASGAVKNQHFQNAAKTAATTAVQSTLQGTY